jgi:hypothetical protein
MQIESAVVLWLDMSLFLTYFCFIFFVVLGEDEGAIGDGHGSTTLIRNELQGKSIDLSDHLEEPYALMEMDFGVDPYWDFILEPLDDDPLAIVNGADLKALTTDVIELKERKGSKTLTSQQPPVPQVGSSKHTWRRCYA